MALLRAYASDGYWTDHGILVVRDGEPSDPGTGPGPGPGHGPGPGFGELLAEGAVEAQPGGTIAMAGDGWLWANASSGDADARVRLEAHDDVPPDDRSGWDEVMETPYHCGSGTAELGWLTAEDSEGALALGPPGLYRVRASCRRQREDEGDTWRLQFWPAAGKAEPPRWLARHDPAAGDESPGWEETLDYDVATVLWGAQFAAEEHPGGASAVQIAAARPAYHGGHSAGNRPDDPVWEPAPPAPLTTGHPDRDADEAQIHAEILEDYERQEHELAEIAAQLGVPAPATVSGVLTLLVAAGLLTVRDAGSEPLYLPVAEPPRVQDVLALPAAKLAELGQSDEFNRYAALAADLVAVALWTPGGRVGTVSGLAERLLASPAQVRAALRFGARAGLMIIDGDADQASAPLTLEVLAALARSRQEPQVAVLVSVLADGPGTTLLPDGNPPRAGLLTSAGDLVAWRDGGAVVLARAPDGQVDRAIQTGYGIVLLSSEYAVLVRHDGRTQPLAGELDFRTALSEDGRRLAVSESHYGKRPWSQLHVIDLADGSRQTLHWPRGHLAVAGLYGGAVSFSTDQDASMRWVPGSAPEPLPFELRAIDPLTGTALAEGGADGPLVISQGGERRHIPVTQLAELAPGGTHLYDLRYEPPALTLFDISAGGAAPRICWLPAGTQVSTTGPGHPVWEDAGHMLFARPYDPDPPAVRLDVRTGAVECVRLTGAPGDRPTVAVFVRPLLRS